MLVGVNPFKVSTKLLNGNRITQPLLLYIFYYCNCLIIKPLYVVGQSWLDLKFWNFHLTLSKFPFNAMQDYTIFTAVLKLICSCCWVSF